MTNSRHATFRMLFAGALLALLAACASTPGGPGPASEARAERLVRQGNHAEAARMYEELASNNAPPARDQFALAAARAWLDANRADDAQRALALASPQLPANQQFERELLSVETAAARGQYQAAWQQVSRIAEPAQSQDAARLFYLRQQVAVRAGETSAAVQAGTARERVASDETGRNRARRDLLNDLRGAIDRGQRIEPAASNDALERGWLELAQIASTAGRSPLNVNAMVDRWRQRFPGHPASTILASEILDPAARPSDGTRMVSVTGPVALLLPLSDRALGARAALVRDGFQSAAARLPDGILSDVRIYDTASMSVAAALRAASSDGATFIVGPLTREEVQEAVQERPAHIPMLLLNTSPGGASPGTWQYALAPEDEARQIARQVARSGRSGAVVLTPAGEWGQRVAAAFSDELRTAGGQVLAEGIYDVSRNNIDSTLTAALGIDASRTRRSRVEAALGTSVQFEPRPMPGIDALFVAGYDELAMRQIRPYLRQYNAIDIPTYMTSEGISGDRAANRDLDGTRLLEMPWTLDTIGAASDVRNATQGSWGSRGTPRQVRLFAFGYDAATLAASLRRGISSWPIEGVTGRLTLAADGRIERQLNWARVREGAVQAADPSAP
jgi:outer membrane PBP1 activator LpoA protein